MINLMNMEEWMTPDELEAEKKDAKEEKKSALESKCACGRKVCCGKHKNGRCACSKGGRQHD